VGVAAAVFFLSGGAARADLTKDQCAAANADAQDLRRDGKLAAARGRLLACVDAACPDLVRDDCIRRLDELERAQPTIAFEVKDPAGNDVFAVSVTLDGAPWAASIEGKALAADPGKHVFTFAVAGYVPIMRTIVLTEGEKGRRERIILESPAAAAGMAAPAVAEATAPTPAAGGSATAHGGMGTQKVLGFMVGGAGVAGLVVGGIFGGLTTSAWSSAKSACGGNPAQCTDVASGRSHRSTAESDATVSTIGFATGGALLLVGAALFLTGRSEQPGATAIAPEIGPGQVGIALRGGF
jgi:hypothetical protein